MFYTVMRSIVRPAAKICWRPTLTGIDNIPPTGPVIIAANHLSFWDSILIPCLAPRQISYLAKKEYFTGTGVRGLLDKAFFTGIGSIPVDRDETRAAQQSLDLALDHLRTGGAFGIYPEGTRSRDGRLYRGHTGVGHLVLASKAPVVPVGVTGTGAIQRPGSSRIHFPKVALHFGPAIDFTGRYEDQPAGKARRLITDDIMAAIHDITGQELAGSYNSRPVDAA